MSRLLLSLFLSMMTVHATAQPISEVAAKANEQGFRGVISTQSDTSARHYESSPSDYNKNTRFGLASVSKLFTQMAILQLQDRSLLDINQPVGQYLRQNQIPEAWKSWIHKVTLKQLILHRSGLPQLLYPSEGMFSIRNHAGQPGNLVDHFFAQDNARIDDTVLEENLSKAGKDGEVYSNIGYNILAVVIENVSGTTYADFLQQNIFRLSDMKDTFSITENDSSFLQTLQQASNMPAPSVIPLDLNAKEGQEGGLPHVDLLPEQAHSIQDFNYMLGIGAGSIISTAKDLNNWVEATFIKKKLLSPYALRLFISFDKDKGGDLWGHQGGMPGYQTILFINLSTYKSAVVLSNLDIDNFEFLTKVECEKGASIDEFSARGGSEGIMKELENAMDKTPYLSSLNVAIALLDFQDGSVKTQPLVDHIFSARCSISCHSNHFMKFTRKATPIF